MLAAARLIAKRLASERADWASALALLIRACMAACEMRSEDAIALFGSALQRFDALDMNLFAAVCRRRLGQLTGGMEGRAHIQQADAWMAGQGIRNPTRMMEMMAPGVPD